MSSETTGVSQNEHLIEAKKYSIYTYTVYIILLIVTAAVIKMVMHRN